MKNALITIVLVIGGLILSFVCLEETNSTSLLAYHNPRIYQSFPSGPVVQGQNIKGEFLAAHDNLGMVKLRIETYNRINTTHIRFQIREKGTTSWLATNTYTLDRFVGGLLYPFGFPVIADSKGKTYEFLLESLDGVVDDAIGIRSGYHDTATQYVFQKNNLLQHRQLLGSFLLEKAKNILADPYMILYLAAGLVPAFVYWKKKYGEIAIAYMLLVYTYVPLSMHSNTILAVAAFVAGIAFFMRTHSSRIYLAALVWLGQIPIMIALGNTLAADRAATLIFFLILIGVMISLGELKKK